MTDGIEEDSIRENAEIFFVENILSQAMVTYDGFPVFSSMCDTTVLSRMKQIRI